MSYYVKQLTGTKIKETAKAYLVETTFTFPEGRKVGKVWVAKSQVKDVAFIQDIGEYTGTECFILPTWLHDKLVLEVRDKGQIIETTEEPEAILGEAWVIAAELKANGVPA